MLDKLEAIKGRFDQVGLALTNPEIISNQKEFGRLSKEYRSLEKIVKHYDDQRVYVYADNCPLASMKSAISRFKRSDRVWSSSKS